MRLWCDRMAMVTAFSTSRLTAACSSSALACSRLATAARQHACEAQPCSDDHDWRMHADDCSAPSVHVV